MTDGPLIQGIPALGPGASRKMVWGIVGALWNKIGHKQILIICRFKNATREMPPVLCILEIKSLYGPVDAVDPDGMRQCARELKAIVECMERDHAALVDGLKGISKAIGELNGNRVDPEIPSSGETAK